MFKDQLRQEFSSSHHLHYLARYHLSSEGKCLRGKLALAEAEFLGVPREKAEKWALVCELLHNATLIHDDIQDNDPMRRGQVSLWKKSSVAEAINTGDLFIFRAFNLASQLGNPALTSLLSDISESLVQGQMDELLGSKNQEQGLWELYKKIAQHKTGSLFLLPIEGAYILAEQKIPTSLKEAWIQLGCCYQIVDDIRDFYGLKQSGQKEKDFDEKQINALIAQLYEFEDCQNLVENYLQSQIETSEFEQIKIELRKQIKEKMIIEDLQQKAWRCVEEFKTQASLASQKVVMSFLEKAIPSGDSIYENI